MGNHWNDHWNFMSWILVHPHGQLYIVPISTEPAPPLRHRVEAMAACPERSTWKVTEKMTTAREKLNIAVNLHQVLNHLQTVKCPCHIKLLEGKVSITSKPQFNVVLQCSSWEKLIMPLAWRWDAASSKAHSFEADLPKAEPEPCFLLQSAVFCEQVDPVNSW